MVRHDEIATGTPTDTPALGHNATGPRDVREAAFTHVLTSLREDGDMRHGDRIVPAAGLFFAACTAFVVGAAIWASVIG